MFRDSDSPPPQPPLPKAIQDVPWQVEPPFSLPQADSPAPETASVPEPPLPQPPTPQHIS